MPTTTSPLTTPRSGFVQPAFRSVIVIRFLRKSLEIKLLHHRYGHLLEFAPAFLQAFTFRSNLNPDSLLQAIELLRTLNQERRRAVPENAPLKFIPGGRPWRSCRSPSYAEAHAGTIWRTARRRYPLHPWFSRTPEYPAHGPIYGAAADPLCTSVLLY
jgi:hypothetical protein